MMQRHTPIGYQMIDGKIYIDEEKSKVVIKVFRDYLNGTSTYALSKELTAIGFLNANHTTSWNHGSIGKILENTKYLGDAFYPQIIPAEIFSQVQERREARCKELGRASQLNSMQKQHLFSGRLRCGECGEVFRRYIEHCGKPSERSNWKCKKYIDKNRVCCRCGTVTDSQIEAAFLSAANKIIVSPRLLDRKQAVPPVFNREYQELDRRVKELEEQKQFSSSELSGLIFQRAVAFYQTARIDDHEHNTEKMKQAFFNREPISVFDEGLFTSVIRQITIYTDKRLTIEFINGLTLEETY